MIFLDSMVMKFLIGFAVFICLIAVIGLALARNNHGEGSDER